MKISILNNFYKNKLDTKYIFCLTTLLSLLVLFVDVILTSSECLKSFFFFSYVDLDISGSGNMDTGMDFFNSIVCTYNNVPYTKYSTLYPPLANLFFSVLCRCVPLEQKINWINYEPYYRIRWTIDDLRIHQETLLMYVMFIIICSILLIFIVEMILNDEHIINKLVAVSVFFSYGNLYAIERGNIIIIVIPLILFFWFYKDSKNKIVSEMALIALAIASGIKLYPAILGFILLVDKQFSKAIRTIIYGLIAFFIPFFAFEGIEAIPIFFDTLFNFTDTKKYNGYGIINYYNILKLCYSSYNIDISFIYKPFMIIKYIICILMIIFSYITKKRWKCSLFLTLIIILFQSSYEYTLTFFILPFVAFLLEEKKINVKNFLYYFLFIFIVVPIPITEFIAPYYYTWKCFYLQVAIIFLTLLSVSDGFNSLIKVNAKK